MKKGFKRLGALFLALLLCTGFMNVPKVQAEEQKADIMESVYEGENYRVKFVLSGYWQGGYNANISIENTGDVAIENWYLKFPFQDNISNIWNAVINQYQDGVYVIKNADWNQDIPVGGSIEFGISVSSDFTTFPTEYEVLGHSTEKQSGDYSVEYCLNSDWGSGFVGSINITNNTNQRLEDWTLEFDFLRNIDSIWNAEVISQENNHYVIGNAGYNANIEAGQTISFGFTGQGGCSTDEPVDYSLYSYEIYAEDLTELDTDNDGLTDQLEITLGLNPNSVDSDGDGLTDYEEINITLTEPLIADTNNNGIIDGEDDIDGDGITNREEIDLGTDPLKADTDGDNLTDYEEVYDYDTNPLLTDTDGDGLTDYDDITLGFSPVLADTDGNGIIDSKEQVYQTVNKQFEDAQNAGVTGVSVSLNTKGNAQKSIAIENVCGIDELSSGVVGLFGVPVDITCNAEFEQAEIVFSYDVNALGNIKEENLSVLWYDEENNWYQILDEDSVIDTQNHTVSYTTTHFSTYMLVDSEAWYNAWRENIDYRNSTSGDTEKKYFDIAFVVDTSLSMSGSRIAAARTAMSNFIKTMQSDDEAAIVRFDTSAYLVCDFTNDKNVLKQGVDSLRVTAGTDVNCGLLKAIERFDTHECDKQKMIVLICDGDVNYVQSTIDKCISNGIQIYAVNVASASAHASLEKMASLTGGQYYYGSSSDMLETIFTEIAGDTLEQIDTTDADGDELYDIYETAGMKLPNGQIIYTNPNKKDTDGDGLTDLQETGLVYNIDDRYIGRGMTVNIKYFQLRSDPTKQDTDDDGLSDDVDERPLVKNFVEVAELDNKFEKSDYLHIELNDGSIYHGGDQSWWQDKSAYQSDNGGLDHVMKVMKDKYYRLWQIGCGTIAMSDAELYMKLQNTGYSLSCPVEVDESSGICDENTYRNYVEQMYDKKYTIEGTVSDYVIGLKPWTMESGFSSFLQENKNASTHVTWARHVTLGKDFQKEVVLDDIEKMLDNNIPVVFSYYDLGEEEIKLYYSLQDARENSLNSQKTNSHYMTVIGLYKYTDNNPMDYKYILKVVSWGSVYYISYDEYADKLSYFSNILSVY